MEADWSVEIGEHLPRIAVPWAGDGLAFVDLRECPDAAQSLPEALAFPVLGWALTCLNSSGSMVFTSKCDVWRVSPDDMDPLEMQSTAADASAGVACYIDLMRRGEAAFASFSEQEAWIKRTTQELRTTTARSARLELVLRQAVLEGADGQRCDGFAVTLYVTGCGRDESVAQGSWEDALAAAVPVLASAV
jgi:hypothetical protein